MLVLPQSFFLKNFVLRTPTFGPLEGIVTLRDILKPVRGRMTKPKQSGAFSGHRFPPEIISYAV
jgi:hypothetical protein